MEGERYQGDRDRDSMELFLKEALSIDVGPSETDNLETESQLTVEDGIYLLTNTTFHTTVAQAESSTLIGPDPRDTVL